MKTSKYAQLESELADYKSVMCKAVDAVIDQDISKYPILVVHQDEINIGLSVIEKSKVTGNWSIRISTLEEFVTKKLIDQIKVDSFRTIYKNQKKFLCLFVLSELGAQFVFLPRNNSQTNSN